MKLYLVEYGDCEGFRRQNGEQTKEWASNKKDAARIANENHDGDYKSSVKLLDVPTDKKGLIEFLNSMQG